MALFLLNDGISAILLNDGSSKLLMNDRSAVLTQTLAPLTLSAAATVGVAATFTKTLAAMTLSAAATVTVQASCTKTLAPLTLNAQATVGVAATFAKTLAPLTLNAQGTVGIQASLSKTLAPLTLSSQAKTAVSATLAQLMTLTFHATAHVEDGGVQPGAIPAFPGAEGYGSTTIGGRGGVSIMVTNLNDSGVGSFRWALDYAGPRIIQFAVSGTINNLTPLKLLQPFVTIAFQTAPGEGITLSGEEFRIQTHDVVIRYMRCRTGEKQPAVDGFENRDACNFGISGQPFVAYNIVLDHCSMSWAVDETCTVDASHDITIQFCLISEALWHSVHPEGPHSDGLLIRSAQVGFPALNISIHDCVLISCNQRMPQFAYSDMVDFRNCLIYNPGVGGFEIEKDGQKRINAVNCHWVRGPNTGPRTSAIHVTSHGASAAVRTQLYISGCTDWNHPDPDANNWPMVHDDGDHEIPDGGNNLDGVPYHVLTPFDTAPVTTRDMDYVKNVLPTLVGATRPYRDGVDTRVINSYLTDTGVIIDTTDQVGGWEPMQPGPVLVDTDADGMPDAWEATHGLDAHEPGDANLDRDGDGYTNIEEYLNTEFVPVPPEPEPQPEPANPIGTPTPPHWRRQGGQPDFRQPDLKPTFRQPGASGGSFRQQEATPSGAPIRREGFGDGSPPWRR